MTESLQSIEYHLKRAKTIWLFLDYDGTLDDFAPTPDEIRVNPEVVKLIQELRATPRLFTAIISGRRLSHIEALIPVPGILLAGTYGVEFRTPEGERVNRADYTTLRPHLEKLKSAWRELLGSHKEFFLEDKDWALAIHARLAQKEKAADILSKARQIAAPAAGTGLFRLLGGDKFLELAPTAASKDQTVAYLMYRYPLPEGLPLYLGDDDKDEVAFATIQAHEGIAGLVAKEPRRTKADFRIPSPQAARQWIKRVLLESPTPPGS